MKKLMIVAAAIAFAMGGLASPNDALLSFSTPGPDKYADGTTVLDGECYALVWTANGAAFAGFKADGTMAADTDKLILVAPVAKDGACPAIVFQVPASTVAELEGKGTYGVYLLDTRIKTDSGEIKLAGVASPSTGAAAVNSMVALTDTVALGTASDSKSATLSASAVAGAVVNTEAIVDVPRITAMKMDGVKITLVVDGLSPIATYKVVTGTKPGQFSLELNAKAKDGTFEFTKPEGSFFKVIGTRNFK